MKFLNLILYFVIVASFFAFHPVEGVISLLGYCLMAVFALGYGDLVNQNCQHVQVPR